MVLSMPAPHGPEDAAPQYQDLFFDVKSHRFVSITFFTEVENVYYFLPLNE